MRRVSCCSPHCWPFLQRVPPRNSPVFPWESDWRPNPTRHPGPASAWDSPTSRGPKACSPGPVPFHTGPPGRRGTDTATVTMGMVTTAAGAPTIAGTTSGTTPGSHATGTSSRGIRSSAGGIRTRCGGGPWVSRAGRLPVSSATTGSASARSGTTAGTGGIRATTAGATTTRTATDTVATTAAGT